jgi:lactoylglutathione lyase
MAKILHLAIKVEDIEAATRFYEEVFSLKVVANWRTGEHSSCHMTDGTFDLSLLKYDSEQSTDAQLSGAGPCLHHWGIEVDDPAEVESRIRRLGGEILSSVGGAVRFRAPDGTVAEILKTGGFTKIITASS